MSCAAALPQLDRGSDYESERHRFESYTPHQSNLKPPATGAFLLRKHCMDSNLGRGASVKRTRSVRSERASAPAGGRSRCGSAWQLNQRFEKKILNYCLTHRGLACIIIRALRRYLSWIEDLTTNQNVIGSNPIRRTNRALKPPATEAFPLRGHCGDSNLGRGASVKKTRSVFSERASPPAGGRSRCGSAQRMRGILYAAPIEFKASGNGGFSYIAMHRRSCQALQMSKNQIR